MGENRVSIRKVEGQNRARVRLTRAKARKIANKFSRTLLDDHISAYAAQAAFFIMMSVFPFLILCLSIVKFFPISEGQVIALVAEVIPEYLTGLFVSIIREVFESSVTIMTFSIVTVIWAASKGFRSTCDGLDSVHDILGKRSLWKLYIKAFVYTIGLSIALVICVVLMVFGPAIQQLLEQKLPPLAFVTAIVFSFRALISLIVLGLFFTVMYTFLPNKKLTFSSQLPGGLCCAIAWEGFSFFLSIYVTRFNGFSMYGSLTTIVLLMFWLYCCLYIMFVCAEINVFLASVDRRARIGEKLRYVSGKVYQKAKRQDPQQK